MKTIDLSHFLTAEMPVFPGTPQPLFTDEFTVAKNGFREKKFEMYGHTGTHMDAPAHMLEEGLTLDQLPVSHFTGMAVVVDVNDKSIKEITTEILLPYEEKIKVSDFVLFKSEWSWYWGDDNYYAGFPYLTEEACNWLVSKKLKGVGFDSISADAADSEDFPNHKILLFNNVVIIENLNNLHNLPEEPFLFSCLPLKIKDADGSPIRAVAMVG